MGAIAPYVLAGKMTGGALESGGRVLEANNLIKTGGFTAKFLASERTGMIVGAGLYGGGGGCGAADGAGNHPGRKSEIRRGKAVPMGAAFLGGRFAERADGR